MSIVPEEAGVVPAPEQGLLERLAERLGGSAGAKCVFAEPVERDGITIIPVARASWGLGAGSSRFADGMEAGSGGGGGVSARPMGYIEIRNGTARFRAIRDPSSTVGMLLAAGGLLLLARIVAARQGSHQPE
jgi:uncharacterized spore protein YtfJ